MLDGTEKIKTISNVAALRNVMLLGAAIQKLRDRDPDLPGMGCFHGFSGYGKSSAATYNAQLYDACWVEVKSVWTRKVLVTKIVRALGLTPQGQISDMVEQIGEELAKSGRPLLIDEAHKLCRDDMMGLLHDIYLSSYGSAMVLIGEEMLPQKLRKWERIHNRIGAWPAAQPADLRETRVLADLKQPHAMTALPVFLPPDLVLARFVEATGAPMAELKSTAQTREISRLRQECMWLLRQATTATMAQIGAMLGGRNKMTVDEGVDRVALRAAQEPDYRARLNRLLGVVRGAPAVSPTVSVTAALGVLHDASLSDADARAAAAVLLGGGHAGA